MRRSTREAALDTAGDLGLRAFDVGVTIDLFRDDDPETIVASVHADTETGYEVLSVRLDHPLALSALRTLTRRLGIARREAGEDDS